MHIWCKYGECSSNHSWVIMLTRWWRQTDRQTDRQTPFDQKGWQVISNMVESDLKMTLVDRPQSSRQQTASRQNKIWQSYIIFQGLWWMGEGGFYMSWSPPTWQNMTWLSSTCVNFKLVAFRTENFDLGTSKRLTCQSSLNPSSQIISNQITQRWHQCKCWLH